MKKILLLIMSVTILVSCGYGPRDNAWDPNSETNAGETTAPSVVSITPTDGSIAQAQSAVVTVTFSEMMDRDTVEQTFNLEGVSSVSGTFSWSEYDTVATFVPSDNLAMSQLYTVEIGTAAEDANGNAAAAAVSAAFRVAEPSGTPDSSFSGDGVNLELTAPMISVTDAAEDRNGRIILTGRSNSGSDEDMMIMCFNEDGSLDTTFGEGGFVTHDNAAGGSGDDSGEAVIIDSGNRIVIAGYSTKASNDTDMIIWRYNSDGSPDTSFGTGGFVIDAEAAGGTVEPNDAARCVTIDSQQRILAAGSSRAADPEPGYLAVWRYESNGTLDNTFSGDGVYTYEFGTGGTTANSIDIDSAGRIVIGGNANREPGDYFDFFVCRLTASGSLDTSFSDGDGTEGYLFHDYINNASNGDMNGTACLDEEDRIIVTGKSMNGGSDYNLKIVRFDDEGDIDSSFGTAGVKVYADVAGAVGDETAFDVLTDAADRIVITGCGRNSSGNYDMFLLRLTEDGSLHEPFSSSGSIITSGSDFVAINDLGSAVLIDRYGRTVVAGCTADGDISPVSGINPVIWRFR